MQRRTRRSATTKAKKSSPLTSIVRKLRIPRRHLATYDVAPGISSSAEAPGVFPLLFKREGKVIMPPTAGKRSKKHATKDRQAQKRKG